MNVRDQAAGTVIGSRNQYDQGVITGGPQVQALGGQNYTWYSVHWSSSPYDGWSDGALLGLTPDGVATVAHSNTYNETFSGPNLVTAVAISAAESILWNPNALGDNNTSYGLWQIHVPPNQFDVGLLQSSVDYQAMAAKEIYTSSVNVRGPLLGWKPWTTWWPIDQNANYIAMQAGNGPYKAYLQTARSVMQGIDDSTIRGVGDRVTAAATLSVRDNPAGNILATGGTRNAGQTGTIVKGMPDATYLKYLPSDDRYYVWWQIQWDGDNVVGWSAEDSLLRTGSGAGTPTITSVAPVSIAVNQGSQFTITYTVNGSASPVILGASLFPSGQTTGRIDDPADDQVVTLNSGQSVVSRQFSVPSTAAPGSYDLVVALWNDLNGNGVIDPTIDQEFPEFKVTNAVAISPAGSACTYTLSPSVINLPGWGGAQTGFGVFTDATCSWSVIAGASWGRATANASGTGSEEVNITIDPNTSAFARSMNFTVGQQVVTVTQAANPYTPPGGNQNVTVLDIFYTPTPVYPGRPIEVISDISSPIAQNVLLGATLTVSGTSTTYYDSPDDVAMTIYNGTNQRYRTFVLPISAPAGSYDIEVGVWADNNGNGIIDPTIDTPLGSFTMQNAVTVQPAQGYAKGIVLPPSLVSFQNFNVDGGNWLGSGLNFQVPVGAHTISFKPVPGMVTPSNQIISVQANQTTTATGTYITIPVVSSVSYSPSAGFEVSWEATQGYTYSVWRSSDVAFPNPTMLASGLTADNPVYTDPAASQAGAPVFYQVRVDSVPDSGGTSSSVAKAKRAK